MQLQIRNDVQQKHVSILVLMDLPFLQPIPEYVWEAHREVSILVLMDLSFLLYFTVAKRATEKEVSILVLMDLSFLRRN